MEGRLWRGGLEEKNLFSREGVNRSLQDTAPGPAVPHPGDCLQDSLFSTVGLDGRAPGRAPSMAPRKLGPLGSHPFLGAVIFIIFSVRNMNLGEINQFAQRNS